MKREGFIATRINNYQRQREAAAKLGLWLFKTWWGGFATLCAFVLLCEAWNYVACRCFNCPPDAHWKRDLASDLLGAAILTFVFRRWLKDKSIKQDHSAE